MAQDQNQNQKKAKPVVNNDKIDTYITDFIGKKCDIRTISGPIVATVIGANAYEILVEEGSRNSSPVRKMMFKHAIISISERPL